MPHSYPPQVRRPHAVRSASGVARSALGAVLVAASALAAPAIAATGGEPAVNAPHFAQGGPRRGFDPARPPRAMAAPGELTGQVLYEFLLAEVALQRGQPVIAAQAYADLARRTRDPRIAQRATEIATYARAPNLAVDSARIWQEVAPESEDATRVLGALLVSTNRLDEARPHLQRVLAKETDPRQREIVMMQLNQLLAGASDKPAVLELVRSLVKPFEGEPAAKFALAQAAAAANQDELAIAEVRAAAKLRPGWEPAALLEAGVLQKQSNGAALASMRAFLADYPKSREVRMSYARTLVADKQYAPARAEFQRLVSDHPDNVDVVYSIALLSMQLQDYELAEANLKRLLELPFRDRAAAQLYLGQIAEEQKRFPEALKWYREVQSGEQGLTARVRESGVMAKQGDLDGARKLLQNATATNNQQRVQLILAETQLLRDAKQEKEAFDTLERALDKLPNHPDLLYDYAMLAERLDRVDVMETNLRKVIAIKPDHAHAYNALGFSLADRNMRLAEARELIEKALKLAPDDYFILDSMGWVLFRQGDLPGALKLLERAYAGRPDGEIGAHLGEVLWTMGRRDDAEKVWRDAAGKFPDHEVLKRTMRRFMPTTADGK